MNLEHISQFILTFFITVLCIWFFTPLVKDFINTKLGVNTNKKEIDLDHLIRKKENMLRRNEIESTKDGSKNDLVLFSKNLEKRNNEKDLALINMIKAFQWGDGPEFRKLVKDLSSSISIDIESTDFITLIKFELNQIASIYSVKNEIPEFDKLYAALKQSLLLRLGLKGKIKGINRPVSSIIIIKSCLLYLTFDSDSIYQELIDEEKINSLTKKCLNKNIIKIVIDNNKETKDFLSCLSKNIDLISSLTPLEPLKHKQDINTAYKILHLSESSTAEEIKRKYKELAMKQHPDMFKSYNFSEDVENILGQNFSKIKEAYDLLLKSKDKGENDA